MSEIIPRFRASLLPSSNQSISPHSLCAIIQPEDDSIVELSTIWYLVCERCFAISFVFFLFFFFFPSAMYSVAKSLERKIIMLDNLCGTRGTKSFMIFSLRETTMPWRARDINVNNVHRQMAKYFCTQKTTSELPWSFSRIGGGGCFWCVHGSHHAIVSLVIYHEHFIRNGKSLRNRLWEFTIWRNFWYFTSWFFFCFLASSVRLSHSDLTLPNWRMENYRCFHIVARRSTTNYGNAYDIR